MSIKTPSFDETCHSQCLPYYKTIFNFLQSLPFAVNHHFTRIPKPMWERVEIRRQVRIIHHLSRKLVASEVENGSYRLVRYLICSSFGVRCSPPVAVLPIYLHAHSLCHNESAREDDRADGFSSAQTRWCAPLMRCIFSRLLVRTGRRLTSYCHQRSVIRSIWSNFGMLPRNGRYGWCWFLYPVFVSYTFTQIVI